MNKHILGISKGEKGRILAHFPLGILTCLLGYTYWWLALVFSCGFVIYEVDEDWHIRDGAFTDIKGWLWGVVFGGFIMFLLKLGGVI